jgi:phosphoesterase RecJ-like protein
MPIDWAPLVDLVQRQHRFLLTTHIRPDADGLGSMLALAEVLEQLGKQVQMVISSNWPPRYDFMDPKRRIGRFTLPGDDWRGAEAVIILDTGTWNQLGDFGTFLAKLSVPKVVIDHHLSQDNLGAIALVDTSAEATGRLIYEALQALEAPLPPSAAEMLFAAVATDTGWFRHSNTTPATLTLGAKLMQDGARPTHLYEQLYERATLPQLRLKGLFLDRIQTTAEGQVAYSAIYRNDYPQTGAVPADTEDLINYLRALAGVELAVFFAEQPAGGVKVSFRSRARVDVARLAEQFDGGGHRRAAGAILRDLDMKQAQAVVLEAVQKALEAAPESS